MGFLFKAALNTQQSLNAAANRVSHIVIAANEINAALSSGHTLQFLTNRPDLFRLCHFYRPVPICDFHAAKCRSALHLSLFTCVLFLLHCRSTVMSSIVHHNLIKVSSHAQVPLIFPHYCCWYQYMAYSAKCYYL